MYLQFTCYKPSNITAMFVKFTSFYHKKFTIKFTCIAVKRDSRQNACKFLAGNARKVFVSVRYAKKRACDSNRKDSYAADL